MEDIWRICPLCDSQLDVESVGPFGRSICPKGHFEYQSQGSYASMARITINEQIENFHFDDMFGDEEKFQERVKQLRMKKVKLWLDDERDPKDPYIQSEFGAEGDEVWVKTAQSAISYLKMGNVESISLDHDLGPNAGSGMDVAKWIEENAFKAILPRLVWAVHSMNSVGRNNITKAMQKADEFWNAQIDWND